MYDAPLAVQLKVVDPPADTEAGVAVNAEICGSLPVGTLADV